VLIDRRQTTGDGALDGLAKVIDIGELFDVDEPRRDPPL